MRETAAANDDQSVKSNDSQWSISRETVGLVNSVKERPAFLSNSQRKHLSERRRREETLGEASHHSSTAGKRLRLHSQRPTDEDVTRAKLSAHPTCG